MADNIIGIKFGVAGGKGFQAGSSGALIKEQLEYIASKIKLKVNINKTYFKNQLSSLKKELDRTLGSLNINIRANVRAEAQQNGGSSNEGEEQKQEVTYESLRKTLEKLYQTKAKLLKLSDEERKGTVNGTLLSRQAKELNATYKEQFAQLQELLGKDDERVKSAKKLESALKKAYKTQQASAATPAMANETALAKLDVKAQSLYTDNGFDKIIARSKEAAQKVDEFHAKVQAALNQEGGVTKEEVAKLNTEFLNTQARLKEIGRETDTLGNKIKEAFSSKVIQRIAQTLLLTLLRALKQVYDNVRKIDAAMTELKIITGATSKEMETAAKNIAKAAKEIGSSVADLINSTSVYARLGYTLEQAQSLAKNTAVYSNITGVSVSEATTNITGAIKAYNISLDEVETTLDKFIWVGNKFAISQAEIGEAMNNAASTLKGAGNSLDEAMGILAAANASVQDVSKSSTGVRTIAARISASEAELIELGEDVGDIISTAKLHEQMQAFGVAIIDVNGDLRSTYDILNDLAQIWNKSVDEGGLSELDKAAIGNMFAGNRQRNVFESIMNNWQDAQKVAEGATSAIGSLQNANATYLDSIEGKTKQLQAAWEEFSTNILNSDLVKGFVDVLTFLANILDAVTSVGNGFVAKGAVAGAAVVLFTLLLGKLKAAILAFTGATTLSLKTIGAAITKFMSKAAPILILSTLIALMTSLTGQARGWTELIVGFIATIVSAIVLGLHFVDEEIKLFETSNPLGWIMLAITAVIAVVKGIFDLIEAFNPSYETLKDAAKDSIDAWKDAEDELGKVSDKLDAIREKIAEINKQPLNVVNQQELKYLEEQENNLKADLLLKEEEAERAKKKAAADAAAAIDKYNDTHTVEDAPWYEWLLIGPWAFIHQGIAWGSDTYEEKYTEILKDYQNASQEDKDFITSTLQEYEEMLGEFDFGDNTELDPHLAQFRRMKDQYLLQTGHATEVWSRVLSDTRFTSEVEKLQELADSQGVTMDAISSAAPQFLDYLRQIGVYTDGDTQSTDALIESIKELRKRLEAKTKITFTDDIDIMQDKFNSLTNGLKDIDKTGVISMDNIAKILDKDAEGYPALLSKYFNYVDGVGYQLTSQWADKTKSQILNAMARDEIQLYADELYEAQNILSEMSADNEDYATATNNVAVAQENLNTKITEWATLLREQALEDETERLQKLQDALEEQEDKYKELIDIRKDLLETYKDELKYQQELAKKQKNVADLQTQLSLAMLDKSASGQAKVRDLQQQLSEAQEDLDEYTLDKAIKDLTAQLDEDYDAYKVFLQEQIDRIVAEIENLASTFKIDFTPNSDGSYTIAKHHDGGFVGNMVALKSNEEFAKLLNGELVVTPQQMDSFMKTILPSLIAYDGNGKAVINNNSPLVEIKCGNVDKETLPQLRALVDQAVAKIEKDMQTALARTGYKKTY